LKQITLALFLVISTAQLWAQEESVYATNYQLRTERKVGAGLALGGSTGVLGGLVDLNIEDDDGALIGFGTGSGYQTVSLSWKHSFEGEYFTPYTTLGMAHWWDSGKNADGSESALLKNFLREKEKRSRTFGLELITAAVGMQFNQLSGDLAGSAFFIEFGMLWGIDRAKMLPTGSVGTLYYF
jgi:hypothetical protein